jgi:RimJ/RimL family protein N-acetyltransferase
LEALCSEEPVSERHDPPKHFASYVALLRSLEPVKRTWMGPAYVFTENVESERPVVSITGSNADMLRGGFEGLLEEVSEQPPFVAIVEDGRAVSVCRSVRITDEAHEAGVETLPECRGRDYARHAVAAWARMVHWLGALALYSTSWENKASQRVAVKLKLLMYGSDFHVT